MSNDIGIVNQDMGCARTTIAEQVHRECRVPLAHFLEQVDPCRFLHLDAFDVRYLGTREADRYALDYMVHLMHGRMRHGEERVKHGLPWYCNTDDKTIDKQLIQLLKTATNLGRFVDAANYAMMLEMRRAIQAEFERRTQAEGGLKNGRY